MGHDTCKHYNQEVAFFQSFLDPYMKYTSGLFENPMENLETAIVRMLDKHIEFGGVIPESRVLEIGSGWGSLVQRLANRSLPVNYFGVSPSAVQNDHIQARLGRENVSLLTAPFEETDFLPESFDSIFLSGSFCHLRDKEEQLKRLLTLLKPNGRIVIEDTFFLTEELYQLHANHPATKFVQTEIFGFAHILSWEVQELMFTAAGLAVDCFLDHTDSYRITIEHWIARLERLDATRFPLKDSYIKYLKVAQKGWGRTIVNYLVSLKKADAVSIPHATSAAG